jgi:hypothetical protein
MAFPFNKPKPAGHSPSGIKRVKAKTKAADKKKTNFDEVPYKTGNDKPTDHMDLSQLTT